MNSLREFLKADKAVVNAQGTVDIGGRLRGMLFVVRALSYDEWSQLQLDATITGADGKSKLNAGRMHEQMVLKCCLEPSFADADFIEANDCKTPKELLHSLLKPGEILDLGKEIGRLSGFDQGYDKLVTEAKN